MTNWFYGSTRLDSTRFGPARCPNGATRRGPVQLFRLGSVCLFIVLLLFIVFFCLYLLANFLLRAFSFHFILLINLLEELLFTANVHSDIVCRLHKKSLPAQMLCLSDLLEVGGKLSRDLHLYWSLSSGDSAIISHLYFFGRGLKLKL